jgi:hypothetical protein
MVDFITGILPYAFRMSCGDHTFEIGSLCHGEQELWVQGKWNLYSILLNEYLLMFLSNSY